jgi:formate-dependent nitrite reductase cytochrome c552 subunit
MKHAAGSMLLLVPLVLVLAYLTGSSEDSVRAVAAPPLSLEGYLDEVLPEASDDDAKIKVDNQSCYVCHGNYDGEELVVAHGKEKIGCIDCHGESLAHRNDEDNITPPDKMYALEDIDKMCGACHAKHEVPAREVIRRWKERCPTKTNPKEIVCTDCHFHHRLRFRTVWWDKKTRKLIIREKGQRIKIAPDLTKGPPEQQPGDKTNSN